MFRELTRDIKDTKKKTQIELLEMETIRCEMKNTLNGINIK